MNIPTSILISTLERQTTQIIDQAGFLLPLPASALRQRPAKGGWNALECIEHLNRYGAFYLPEIKRRIGHSPFKPAPYFKPGIMGDYFAKSMTLKKGGKRMKTFKQMDPLGAPLDKQCIYTFIEQQNELLHLLQMASAIDLNRTKTSVSFTRLITLKLGDTLRFVINHNERHLNQAMAALPANASHPAHAATGN